MKYSNAKNIEFLEEMLSSGIEKYESEDWLQSSFISMQWSCNFGKSGKFIIDFQKLIENKIATPEFINITKHWLIKITKDNNGGMNYSPAMKYNFVCSALSLIDYFIINNKNFLIFENGLSLLTKNSLYGAMHEISASPDRSTSIYNYKNRVIDYIRNNSLNLSKEKINLIISEKPELLEINEIITDESLSKEEIICMRAWLYQEGFLTWKTSKLFQLNSKKISAILFNNTLRGLDASWPIIRIFTNINKSNRRKLVAIPVSKKLNGTTSIAKGNLNNYLNAIKTLLELSKFYDDKELFPSLSTFDLEEINIKPEEDAHFKSLPASVVFDSLRNAIEFCEKKGDLIVESYLNIVKNKDLFNKKKGKNLFSQLIHNDLIKEGVKDWHTTWNTPKNNNDFLLSLNNYIKVLYGATAIIVGTLMARRQIEMLNLDSVEVLDSSGNYLIFRNAKSTKLLGGIRKKEARPIIKIAAQAIQRLQKIHTALSEEGFINGKTKLFQTPSNKNPFQLTSPDPGTLNSCLDTFCDFTGTKTSENKRYYVRLHQLRRFFCIIFFWHRSFEGLDTLRWFLGHRDLHHVYRYITESTQGSILRNIKAHHAAANLASHANLRDYLHQRFGISDYILLDSNKIESYIEILIEEGNLSVEPVFYKSKDGNDYKIIIKVQTDE